MKNFRSFSSYGLVCFFLCLFSLPTPLTHGAPSDPPTLTPAGLLQYSNFSTFYGAFRDFPKEDFEESSVPDGSSQPCTGPINSESNELPFCFVPGDILPGLSIDGENSQQFVILGAGVGPLTTTSKALMTSAASPLEIMSLSFEGGINAVGLDLAATAPATTYEVNFYGEAGNLLETVTTAEVSSFGTFIGWYSAIPIHRMT